MRSHRTDARYALIGDPVEHSLSPFIMNRALEINQLGGRYDAVRVGSGLLDVSLARLQQQGVLGVNVTYPLKERVIGLADHLARSVEVIGAANTLLISDDGIEAHNTDAVGAAVALEHGGVRLEGGRVVILGAGGSARAAAYGLLDAGVESVTFAVRDRERAAKAIERIRTVFAPPRIDMLTLGDTERVTGELRRASIVVNATPVGMKDNDAVLLVSDRALTNRHVCFDFVYNPRATPFLNAARRSGARTVDGLTMLVAQARASFEIWTNETFDIGEMLAAVTDHVTRNRLLSP